MNCEPLPDASSAAAVLEALFRGQRSKLWGLAYRMTGSADDAEDVVQEAFIRLLAEPGLPPGSAVAWLVRVATNLAIDSLRRRRRAPYSGPWLPSPIETRDAELPDLIEGRHADPETRYGLAESATYAFLVALEVLTPRQRAVLLFRDVVGYSPKEIAERLATSEGNVRILHLRARKALERYDRERCTPTPELQQRHLITLQRFLACLEDQDRRGLEELLVESVETVTDAGGEYTALAVPLVGRARVATLYLTAAAHRREGGQQIEFCIVNGLPAALITLERPVRRQAPRSLLRCELAENGQIAKVYAILAPRKLSSLRAA
jgi:RNA polymerase sigma-70 factor, ECF subfamily